MTKLEILSAREMYPQTYKLFDEVRKFVSKYCGLQLPDVMLDLHTVKKDAWGWFRNRSVKDGWVNFNSGSDILEIGLNPAGQWNDDETEIKHRPTYEVVGTLVHEVCHLADHVKNNSKRQDNHSEYWKRLMEKVGLKPVCLEPGKERSNKYTHEIMPDGAFMDFLRQSKVLQDGFEFEWRKNPKRNVVSKKTQSTFECPECGATLRGAVQKIPQLPVCGMCSGTKGLVYYNEYQADGTFVDNNKRRAANA